MAATVTAATMTSTATTGMAAAVPRFCCTGARPPAETRLGVVTKTCSCASQGHRQYHGATCANPFHFWFHNYYLRA